MGITGVSVCLAWMGSERWRTGRVVGLQAACCQGLIQFGLTLMQMLGHNGTYSREVLFFFSSVHSGRIYCRLN